MNPVDMDSNSQHVFLSLVIPAHNEEGCIANTCRSIAGAFAAESIHDYEMVVINDNSSDRTGEILKRLSMEIPFLRVVDNKPPNGFGFAVRRGLDEFRGEAVCVVMADLSDAPEDVISYYRELKKGAECVFGSRFMKGSRVYDYPWIKLVLNRMANAFIKVLFRISLNDTTNAFKAYRREVIEGVRPILSHHFNLTVELPLKAIVRGYDYTMIPISWRNRTHGVSKLKIKEMGSRYLFIVLYIWLEKMLSRGDYRRKHS